MAGWLLGNGPPAAQPEVVATEVPVRRVDWHPRVRSGTVEVSAWMVLAALRPSEPAVVSVIGPARGQDPLRSRLERLGVGVAPGPPEDDDEAPIVILTELRAALVEAIAQSCLEDAATCRRVQHAVIRDDKRLNALRDPNVGPAVRERVLGPLAAGITGPAIEELVIRSSIMQAFAPIAVALAGWPSAVLDDAVWEVHYASERCHQVNLAKLLQVRPPGYERHMIAALEQPEHRLAAIDALGAVGTMACAAALAELVRQGQPIVGARRRTGPRRR